MIFRFLYSKREVSILNCQNFATIRAIEKAAGLLAYANQKAVVLIGTGSTSTDTVIHNSRWTGGPYGTPYAEHLHLVGVKPE